MAKKINRGELAEKYAKALLQEAIEHDETETIAQEIRQFGQLMDESPELNKLMVSRLINVRERDLGLSLASEKMGLSDLMRRFLKVLNENGRTFVFKEIAIAFGRLYDEYKGILPVSVVSALELNDQTQQRLTNVLKEIFNKEIRLQIKVDPSLVGGLTVQAGSLMADASVKTKLQKLNLVMKGVGI